VSIGSLAAVSAVTALLLSSVATGQASRERDEAWQRHFEKVRDLLPLHSALPPMLDLADPGSTKSAQAAAAGRAWERKYTGSMLAREISDPGIGPDIGPGSISTRTVEYVGKRWAIPAASCEAILRVQPTASSAHITWTRRFVYSTFALNILDVFKGEKKQGLEKGGQLRAVQFGGTIRFPSRHLETFVTAGEGFMGLGKEYLVFLWKPIRSDNTWLTTEAYVIERDIVFPLITESWNAQELANHERGIPEKDFEAKVKAAIGKNVNTDY
jgi:hypothetical protein